MPPIERKYEPSIHGSEFPAGTRFTDINFPLDKTRSASKGQTRRAEPKIKEENLKEILSDTTGKYNEAQKLQAATWAHGYGKLLGKFGKPGYQGIDGVSGLFTRRALERIKKDKGLSDNTQILSQARKNLGIDPETNIKTAPAAASTSPSPSSAKVSAPKAPPLTHLEKKIQTEAKHSLSIDLDPKDKAQMLKLQAYSKALHNLRDVADKRDLASLVPSQEEALAAGRALKIPEAILAKVAPESWKIFEQSWYGKGRMPGESLYQPVFNFFDNA